MDIEHIEDICLKIDMKLAKRKLKELSRNIFDWEPELNDYKEKQFAFRASEEMHEKVIGLFINKYEFGLSL